MRFGAFLMVLAGALLAQAFVSTASAQSCDPPYRVRTGDGRCVWSCGPGTQPDRATNSCVCQDGLTESSRTANGRRICTDAAQAGAEDDVPRDGDVAPPPRRVQSNLAADHPFNTRPHRLCDTYGRREHAFPYRCATSRERPRQFSVDRRLFITVYKSTPLRADVNQTGRYTVRFNRPPDPPRNRDCDASVTGVRGACDPTCYRVEYLTMFDSGQLHSLRRATGKAADDCSGNLTADYETENPGKALGYDRCWREANRRNLDRWNHNVEILLPRRIAAAYGFKDAHTTGSRGNCRYQLQIQHRMLYAEVELPVTVRCRA